MFRYIKRKLRALKFHTLFAVHGATTAFWKRLDRALAWPDIKYLIDNSPNKPWGSPGGNNYTTWIHQQGFFSALIRMVSPPEGRGKRIMELGCGYGKIASISQYFTDPDGEYVGVDITRRCIDFCKRKYKHLPRTRFFLSGDPNNLYSRLQHDQPDKAQTHGADWPVEPNSVDVFIAVSVWTHLQEEDSYKYMQRVYEVVRPGGVAIITFHLVDEPRKAPRFLVDIDENLTEMLQFKHKLPPSGRWFTSDPKVPEIAIAITEETLMDLVKGKFVMETLLRGSCTGGKDPFVHDVAILRKPLA
jgi:SAM-dependent methyltransferase